jgi:outer membrane immunogenic protein
MGVAAVARGVAVVGALALASGALADGPGRGSIKDARIAAPFSWTGSYIGINAGAAFGESAVSNTFCNTNAAPCYFGSPGGGRFTNAGSGVLDETSFTGGAQIGYNIQSGALVYGVEADFNYLGHKTSRTVRETYVAGGANGVDISDSVGADYLATVRARLGYAAGNMLLYVTGGLAISKLEHSHNVAEFGFSAPVNVAGCFGLNWCDRGGSSSSMKTGWTVGGGGEFALNRNWTFKAEYLYVDLGKVSGSTSLFTPAGAAIADSAIGHSADLSLHIARVGLNYKF